MRWFPVFYYKQTTISSITLLLRGHIVPPYTPRIEIIQQFTLVSIEDLIAREEVDFYILW